MLKKIRVHISVRVLPRYLNDPELAVTRKLEKYLFKYSYKLGGLPVCFDLIGVYPIGNIICDNDSVFLTTSVDFYVFSFAISNVLESEKGITFGIIYTNVNGNQDYTGKIKVTDISNGEEGSTTIYGIPFDSH
ncbi:DNA-directed RNA polymerase I subunit RPA43 [Nosema granulosis]|uniref:DNA-directed RNA polymerase I subunit RPA43 n=1 Tax=Nosema granulosis TaxID=83296 RepID=A0A9P6GX02_9MICR|nr:DNA-directed RNA polymerase I subunit RPA43 [Nosema granulosis]